MFFLHLPTLFLLLLARSPTPLLSSSRRSSWRFPRLVHLSRLSLLAWTVRYWLRWFKKLLVKLLLHHLLRIILKELVQLIISKFRTQILNYVVLTLNVHLHKLINQWSLNWNPVNNANNMNMIERNLTLIFVLHVYAFYSKQVSISTTSTKALICK